MNKKNVTLLYKKNGMPESAVSAISAADENDLRLMLMLSLTTDSDKVDCAPIADALGLSEGELDASIKYWCGAGLIKKCSRTDTEGKRTDAKPKTGASLHKDGKLERATLLPSYSSSELADLIEKRKITTEFIDEAQRIFGKVFNSHEVAILVGIIDYVGFDESAVILILSEMIKNDKRSIRYAEKLAFDLYDMGITTADALHDYFCSLEEKKKAESLVRSMFGMSGRALSSSESRFLNSWIHKMGYGVEVIRLAYDITVDNTQSASPSYANAILKKWNELGLRTETEVKTYLDENKKPKSKAEAEGGTSFDTDDFFNAALRRTFEEL